MKLPEFQFLMGVEGLVPTPTLTNGKNEAYRVETVIRLKVTQNWSLSWVQSSGLLVLGFIYFTIALNFCGGQHNRRVKQRYLNALFLLLGVLSLLGVCSSVSPLLRLAQSYHLCTQLSSGGSPREPVSLCPPEPLTLCCLSYNIPQDQTLLDKHFFPILLRGNSLLLSEISNIPCHSPCQTYANIGHFCCLCQKKD